MPMTGATFPAVQVTVMETVADAAVEGVGEGVGSPPVLLQ